MLCNTKLFMKIKAFFKNTKINKTGQIIVLLNFIHI